MTKDNPTIILPPINLDGMADKMRDITAETETAGTLCRNCQFYFANDKRVGSCRKNPPTGFHFMVQNPMNPGAPQMQIDSYFPPVRNDQWCGEFVAKVKQ